MPGETVCRYENYPRYNKYAKLSTVTNLSLFCPFFRYHNSSPQSKDLWNERIQQSINQIKEKEGKSNTTIQISYWDPVANEDKYTLVKVTNRCTTTDAIQSAIDEFKCDGPVDDYQLWVKTSRDDTPYPLIGHEYPFAIKMNFVRDLLHRSNLDLQNFNNIAADNKCIFILRRSYPKNSTGALLDNSAKKSKNKRRPINWRPFKKISIKTSGGSGGGDVSLDSGISTSEPSTPTKPGKLFGQHLDLLCNGEQLPKPIMLMLNELFQKGPFTVGIFRKSANARVCKEFRAKLESGDEPDITEVPVMVIASVFKEFLRSLPDCLLQSRLYPQWIDSIGVANNHECRERVQRLLQCLPASNMLLLRHTLCALWSIAQQSPLNKMCPVNLGVCVGQSLLTPAPFAQTGVHPPNSQTCEEMSKQVPKLIAYLIDHCPDLFGEQTVRLLGTPTADHELHLSSSSRQDSGAEESDSLNSLPDSNGAHSSDPDSSAGSSSSGGGRNHRCDDSSIDSLERALMDDSVARVSPGAVVNGLLDGRPVNALANKMSLSNLSRDSGLTLSDTQLYTPDEDEECGDDLDQFPTTGGGANGQSYHRKTSSPLAYHSPYLTKSVPHLDQTGLDSDLNVTFSYGRSVGVSIDGSCHDVVMRKRRHLQGVHSTGNTGHYSTAGDYIARNARNSTGSQLNGQSSALTYHNHHQTNANQRHNHNNNNNYYRQSSQPSSSSSALNGAGHHHHLYHQYHSNGYHHHYTGPHHQHPHQHIPIHYSKSYSYGINGDDLQLNGSSSADDHQSMDANNGSAADDCHREYRYRRPPLAAVLGGAPVHNGYHEHHVSAPYLRRSSSEESLIRTGYDTTDGETNGYSLALQYATPGRQSYGSQHQKYYSNTNSNQYNGGHNTGANQVTLRADVHHYNGNSNVSTGTANAIGPRVQSAVNLSAPNRVTSICSNGSSSETASQRSSLSSGKQSSTNSSVRNGSGVAACPPSYHEAMTRKEMLCRAQSNGALNTAGQTSGAIAMRKASSASTSSANSAHIYEESVRIYNSDLDNKRTVTARAVPVRVSGDGIGANTATNSEQLLQHRLSAPVGSSAAVTTAQTLPQQHRHVHRVVSESVANNSRNIVHITAQNNNTNNQVNRHNSTSLSASSQPHVLQRSAKDFAPEEWRKDINGGCKVATLRKLFTKATSGGNNSTGNTSSSSQSSTPSSQSPASVVVDNNTYNIYVRQSSRPVSVLIESQAKQTAGQTKQRPISIQEITNYDNNYNTNYKDSQVSKGVTVVQVRHNTAGANDGQTLGHKRADSVGNSSSEEESYV